MGDEVSRAISDSIIKNHIDLERFGEGVKEKVVGLLNKAQSEIVKEIAGTDPMGPTLTKWRQERLEKLNNRISEILDSTYGEIKGTTTEDLKGVAGAMLTSTPRTFNRILGANIFDVTLTPELLNAVVSKAGIEGHIIGAWWDTQNENTKKRLIGKMNQVAQQVELGMVKGESIGEMISRLRGTATTPGVMSISKREAAALVRTSVHQVAQSARREIYDQNQDVIKGYQIIATLDTRTTPLCRALDLKTYDLNFNPVGHQFPYPAGGPPFHWNCRTTLIPLTKSYRELMADDSGLSAKQRKALDLIPSSLRASMGGPVKDKMDYNDWLKTQTEAVQKSVLGEARWKLWKEHDLSMVDLIHQTGRQYTLKELREALGLLETDELIVKELGEMDIRLIYSALRKSLAAGKVPGSETKIIKLWESLDDPEKKRVLDMWIGKGLKIPEGFLEKYYPKIKAATEKAADDAVFKTKTLLFMEGPAKELGVVMPDFAETVPWAERYKAVKSAAEQQARGKLEMWAGAEGTVEYEAVKMFRSTGDAYNDYLGVKLLASQMRSKATEELAKIADDVLLSSAHRELIREGILVTRTDPYLAMREIRSKALVMETDAAESLKILESAGPESVYKEVMRRLKLERTFKTAYELNQEITKVAKSMVDAATDYIAGVKGLYSESRFVEISNEITKEFPDFPLMNILKQADIYRIRASMIDTAITELEELIAHPKVSTLYFDKVESTLPIRDRITKLRGLMDEFKSWIDEPIAPTSVPSGSKTIKDLGEMDIRLIYSSLRKSVATGKIPAGSTKIMTLWDSLAPAEHKRILDMWMGKGVMPPKVFLDKYYGGIGTPPPVPPKVITPTAPKGVASAGPSGAGLPPPAPHLDLTEYTQYAPQEGSNKGGYFYHVNNPSDRWYFKFPDDEGRIANEILASKLYQAAGVEVPELAYVEGVVDGKQVRGLGSRIIDNVEKSQAKITSGTIRAGIGDAYAVDAWLANWDVVGGAYDNLLVKDGVRAVRCDVGGALLYRAKGGLKGSAFGETVGELETLRDSSKNIQAYNVFKHMTKEELRAGAKKVIGMRDDQIRKIVDDYAPGDTAAKKQLADKLIKRRNYTKEYFEALDRPIPPPLPAPALEALHEIQIKTLNVAHERGSVGKRLTELMTKTGLTQSQLMEVSKKLEEQMIFCTNIPLQRGPTSTLYKNLMSEPLLKNQFVRGRDASSQGYLGPYKGSSRDHWEKTLSRGILQTDPAYVRMHSNAYFETAEQVAAAKRRPYYGFVLDTENIDSASQYGDLTCVFKPYVKPRATFTVGNSSGIHGSEVETMHGTALNNGPLISHMSQGRKKEALKQILSGEKTLQQVGFDSYSYFEAQIYGELRLDRDAQFLVWRPGNTIPEFARDFAKKQGVEIIGRDEFIRRLKNGEIQTRVAESAKPAEKVVKPTVAPPTIKPTPPPVPEPPPAPEPKPDKVYRWTEPTTRTEAKYRLADITDGAEVKVSTSVPLEKVLAVTDKIGKGFETIHTEPFYEPLSKILKRSPLKEIDIRTDMKSATGTALGRYTYLKEGGKVGKLEFSSEYLGRKLIERGSEWEWEFVPGRWSTSAGDAWGTMRHELGHYVYHVFRETDHIPKTGFTEKWKTIFAKYDWKKEVTEYAAEKSREAWAECFSLYFSKYRDKLPAEVVDFIRESFKQYEREIARRAAEITRRAAETTIRAAAAETRPITSVMVDESIVLDKAARRMSILAGAPVKISGAGAMGGEDIAVKLAKKVESVLIDIEKETTFKSIKKIIEKIPLKKIEIVSDVKVAGARGVTGSYVAAPTFTKNFDIETMGEIKLAGKITAPGLGTKWEFVPGSWSVAGRDIEMVFKHELGHHVYAVIKTPQFEKEWGSIFKSVNFKKEVSAHAADKPSEAFAESFSLYFSDARKKLPKKVKDFISKRVK